MEQVTWYVGIDWGSESHAVCVIDAAGHRREERGVDHTADAVQACLDWIVTFTRAAPAQIAVAIETPRGAVVDACLARGLLVFAVNPKQLDRFRDRHTGRRREGRSSGCVGRGGFAADRPGRVSASA